MKKFLTIFMATLMLVSIAMFATGCGISDNWRETFSELADAGYDVYRTTDAYEIEENIEYFDMYVDGDSVECIIEAYRGKQAIFIVFCKDKETAKDLVNQAEDSIYEFADLFEISKSKIEIGRDGTVAYIGTKDAIKAAK